MDNIWLVQNTKWQNYVRKWQKGIKELAQGKMRKKEICGMKFGGMNIKKKVQHFIWIACHNRLPVGSSFRRIKHASSVKKRMKQ